MLTCSYIIYTFFLWTSFLKFFNMGFYILFESIFVTEKCWTLFTIESFICAPFMTLFMYSVHWIVWPGILDWTSKLTHWESTQSTFVLCWDFTQLTIITLLIIRWFIVSRFIGFFRIVYFDINEWSVVNLKLIAICWSLIQGNRGVICCIWCCCLIYIFIRYKSFVF